MSSPHSHNERSNEELDRIQKRANQVTNESLQSTERMRDQMLETQAIGIRTIEEIDEQQEQIDRIAGTMAKIRHEMDQAEDNITNLKKCCGLCVLPWQRTRRSYKRSTSKGKTTPTELSIRPATTKEPKLRMKEEEGFRKIGYINPITNDDRELAMEENLQIVGECVGTLSNMALDMRDKIKSQIVQLETDVQVQVDSANDRVRHATKETRDLLRR